MLRPLYFVLPSLDVGEKSKAAGLRNVVKWSILNQLQKLLQREPATPSHRQTNASKLQCLNDMLKVKPIFSSAIHAMHNHIRKSETLAEDTKNLKTNNSNLNPTFKSNIRTQYSRP